MSTPQRLEVQRNATCCPPELRSNSTRSAPAVSLTCGEGSEPRKDSEIPAYDSCRRARAFVLVQTPARYSNTLGFVVSGSAGGKLEETVCYALYIRVAQTHNIRRRNKKTERAIAGQMHHAFTFVMTLLQCRLENDATDLRVAFPSLLCVEASPCRAWCYVLSTQSVNVRHSSRLED